MGTSSAFTVGLLHALHALRGEMATKSQLARESLYIEQDVLKETVGSQDQVMAAYGGLRHVKFPPGNGEIAIDPLILPVPRITELKSHLMLFYTGITRTAADVAASYVDRLGARRRQLRIMKELVDESIDVLASGMDIRAFGDLLHEAWQAKRSLSPCVSNPEVDDLYDRARAAGAMGGKLTGAGGGGFLLLFVQPDRQPTSSALWRAGFTFPSSSSRRAARLSSTQPETDYQEAEQARQYQSIAAFKEMASLDVTAEAA